MSGWTDATGIAAAWLIAIFYITALLSLTWPRAGLYHPDGGNGVETVQNRLVPGLPPRKDGKRRLTGG